MLTKMVNGKRVYLKISPIRIILTDYSGKKYWKFPNLCTPNSDKVFTEPNQNCDDRINTNRTVKKLYHYTHNICKILNFP